MYTTGRYSVTKSLHCSDNGNTALLVCGKYVVLLTVASLPEGSKSQRDRSTFSASSYKVKKETIHKLLKYADILSLIFDFQQLWFSHYIAATF